MVCGGWIQLDAKKQQQQKMIEAMMAERVSLITFFKRGGEGGGSFIHGRRGELRISLPLAFATRQLFHSRASSLVAAFPLLPRRLRQTLLQNLPQINMIERTACSYSQ